MAISKQSKEALREKLRILTDLLKIKQNELKALQDIRDSHDLKIKTLKDELKQLDDERVSIQSDVRE